MVKQWSGSFNVPNDLIVKLKIIAGISAPEFQKLSEFEKGFFSAAEDILYWVAGEESITKDHLDQIEWLYVIAQGDEDKSSSVDDNDFYEGFRYHCEYFLNCVYETFEMVDPDKALSDLQSRALRNAM
jgi:hypothetical protein